MAIIKKEAVKTLPSFDLHPFVDHPFEVRDDNEMSEKCHTKLNSVTIQKAIS